MKKYNAAIIGTGNIFGAHIEAYLKNPDVTVMAFCDIDETVLNKKSEKYGIKNCYTDFNKMLDAHPEIDLVSVCTWNNAHKAATIAALNAGKSVLCEKPMALSAAEATEMLDAEKKGTGRLMIGFVRRYGNDAELIMNLIKDGALGELYYAKATYIRRNGCPGGWFADKSKSGGGPLIDLGVHVIDLVRYLAGNPEMESVCGVTFNRLGNTPYERGSQSYEWRSSGAAKSDVEDLASAMIKFKGGFNLQVETSFSLHTAKDECKIEIYGTKGGVIISPDVTLHTSVSGYPCNISFPFKTALDFNRLFENEINHFVESVKNNTPFRSPAEDGVEIMKILDAIYGNRVN